MAPWLYSMVQGVGSARLCEEPGAYRRICEGVSANYHTLADFRARTGNTWTRS